jgi:ribA/ribD-fused uncharacterized protein
MLDGKVWPSVEHYFQAMKFPDNEAYQESIRLTKKPEAAKRMGKTEEVPVRPDWATYRDVVMLTAVKEKFSDRHPELKAKLLETGSAILKDASPLDNYWGIGRSKKGRNKLGEILMTVRGELQGGLPAAAAGGAATAAGAVGGAGLQTNALDAMMTTAGVNEANAAAAAAANAAAAAQQQAAGTTVVIQNAPVPAALAAPVLPTVPDAAAAAAAFPSAEEAAAMAANAGTFETLLPQQQAPLAPQGGGGTVEQQSPPVLKILEVNAQAPIPGAAPVPASAPLPVFTNTAAQQAAFVPQTAGAQQGQQTPEPEYKTVTVHAAPPAPAKK